MVLQKGKILTLFFLAILVIGCQTVTDNIVQTLDDKSLSKLEEVEKLLLQYRFEQDPLFLEQAEQKLNALNAEKTYNDVFRGKLLGLQGELEYLKSNISGVKKTLSALMALNPAEEKVFILKALLEKDPEKRIEILKQGVKESYESSQIKLYLADAYFDAGMYQEAVVTYDDALAHLPEVYKEYYAPKRAIAYQLFKNPEISRETSGFLAKEALTLSDVLTITLWESDYFNPFTPSKKIKPQVLLDKLKKAGYFFQQNLELDKVFARKDLAYFLLKIASFLENNPALMEESLAGYNPYLSEQERKSMAEESPIPDVPVYQYYYYAVLFLVEREIMELPDGEHFFPGDGVSGIRYNEILNRLRSYYRP